jgi:polyisoprenoid-binding protein YceI
LAGVCAALLLAVVSLGVVAAVQGPSVLAIDAGNSRVTIDVGRTGLFGFAGHNHEVIAPVMAGKITYDPADWQRSTVSLQFDASALKVTGKGDPPSDIPKVQQAMLGEEVLDVKRFPAVTFTSRRVSATRATPGAVDLLIEGDMMLHGQTRAMAVRVTAAIDPNGLTVRGGFPLKQTDFGIEPVTAAGGTVRVKDEVQVQFVLKARRMS